MISDLENLDTICPDKKAGVIKHLNLLMRSSPVVRFTWAEMKSIAIFLHANRGELRGCESGYSDALLKPYNKWEYAHIFAISKALATGDDLAALRLRVRADNQRLRRTIRKLLIEPVPEKPKSMITKIINKIGVN